MLYLGIFTTAVALRGIIAARQTWVYVFWCLFVVLLLFTALRFEVGCDWVAYRANFEAAQTMPVAEALEAREPLYRLSFILLGELGFGYISFNVFAALVFFAGIAAFAKRQVDPLAFLILCYPVLIINMPMSGVRQGIAIGLMCFAFLEFSRERVVRYVLWIAVATAFHSSAIIFLALAPLIYEMPLSRRLVWMVALLVPGFLALGVTEVVEVANTRYIERDTESGGALFRMLPLTICGLLWIIALRGEWQKRFPKDAKLAMVGSLMMIGVIVVLPISSVIADRIAYYLMPLQAMIFARIPFLNIGLRRVLSVAPYIFLGTLFVGWTILSRHFEVCYTPYQTWLFL